MALTFPQTLRQEVQRFLDGTIALRELYDRTTPGIFTIEEYNDRVATQLAYELIHWIAEFDYGGWSEDEVREELRPFLARTPPQPGPGDVPMLIWMTLQQQEPIGGITVAQHSPHLVLVVLSSKSVTQIQGEPPLIRRSSLVPHVEAQYSAVFA